LGHVGELVDSHFVGLGFVSIVGFDFGNVGKIDGLSVVFFRFRVGFSELFGIISEVVL